MGYKEDEFGELRAPREARLRRCEPEVPRQSLGMKIVWTVIGLVWVAHYFFGVRF